MRKHIPHVSLSRVLATLLLLCLTLILTGCGEKAVYTESNGSMTYTLYEKSHHIVRITVTTEEGQSYDYTAKGIRTDMAGERLGLTFQDLNFDGFDDMMLLSARSDVGETYQCYLWDETVGHYRFHKALSGLHGIELCKVHDIPTMLTAYDRKLVVDPATSDTPAFDILTYSMTCYQWQEGQLTPVSLAELTYYEENEVYCYMTYVASDDEEKAVNGWENVTEKWIFEEDFDPDRWPMGHFFVK